MDKEPETLTEFSEALHKLSDELKSHVETRNYLFQVISGQEQMPKLEANGLWYATIDASAMPSELAADFFTAAMENSERLAINTWEQIGELVARAVALISRRKIPIEPKQTAAPSEDES